MTTSNHQQIDLPKIPTLPPIEMPDASSFLEPAEFADNTLLSPLHPSSVSLGSQDTYTTAGSSSFSDLNATPTTASPELLSPVSPLSAGPMPGLRKSISVDSFIKYRTPSDSVTRPARGNTVGANTRLPTGRRLHTSHPSTDSATEVASSASSSSEGRRERDSRPFQQAAAGPSRSRGASVSTTGDELGDSFFDESDMERSEDLISVVRKGKSKFKRPGDLSLPSRLQTANSSPTMRKTPPPIVPERNSSLTHKLTKQRSLISVNTHFPSSPHPPSDITIAVLGPNGSGKSTVIHKGLKAYGLSEAASSSTTTMTGSETFRYVYRVGRLNFRHAPDCLLRVLEIDVLSWDLSAESSIFPEGAPPIDGLIFCYDASDPESFNFVKMGLSNVAQLKMPTIVFACKSDLQRQVDPGYANSLLMSKYDVGVIEASSLLDWGKKKIRDGFEWIFKAILDPRRAGGPDLDLYWNPASPAVLTAPSMDSSRASSATPTASSGTAHSPLLLSHRVHPLRLASASEDSSRRPISPSRTRSLSDFLVDHEQEWELNGHGQSADSALGVSSPQSRGSLHTAVSAPEQVNNSFDDVNEGNQSFASRDSRPPRWLTIDELLDKLLFVAVSEDDPTFIAHFLLTYRRFTAPRNVLLAMQKRMRALDQSVGDVMFACYAQMKICWLLDHWMKLYPSDFAVPMTDGALTALVKSIIGKTYLLHYGSEFIPFVETLPSLKDQDASWAMKVEEEKEESDDSLSVADVHTATPMSPERSQVSHSSHTPGRSPLPPPPATTARERKASLPLAAAKMMLSTGSPTQASHTSNSELTWSKKLKLLCDHSRQFMAMDPTTLAQEITRLECEYFLKIQPRDWLRHVLGRGGGDPKLDPISEYNQISNHIANWVVSLILCLDKPKSRARAIQHFVDLAHRLRNMNNYSALRAVIAGINSAAFETDASMQIFKAKSVTQHKQYQSYDHLLQAVRAHGKYRMALRNSKGACIPALEIHLSDLLRAHEGNSDFHDDNPNHIHWEKWNMMGRFIDGIVQCQQACRESRKYEVFQDDTKARELLLLDRRSYLMDPDQQNDRIQLDKPEATSREDDSNLPEDVRLAASRPQRDNFAHSKDGTLRKIFFW